VLAFGQYAQQQLDQKRKSVGMLCLEQYILGYSGHDEQEVLVSCKIKTNSVTVCVWLTPLIMRTVSRPTFKSSRGNFAGKNETALHSGCLLTHM